jgi:hypothetical protein
MHLKWLEMFSKNLLPKKGETDAEKEKVFLMFRRNKCNALTSEILSSWKFQVKANIYKLQLEN